MMLDEEEEEEEEEKDGNVAGEVSLCDDVKRK